MTPQSDSTHYGPDDGPVDAAPRNWSAAEIRLQRNRDRLRQHFDQPAESRSAFSTVSDLAQLAAPVAREFVRQHPAATLSGAALAGAWLVRMKPWQFLGSSMIAGLLARQAISMSLSSGSQLISLMASGALRSTTPPPRTPPME